jgi:hypothetical protein
MKPCIQNCPHSFIELLIGVSLSSINPQRVCELAACVNMSLRAFQRKCSAHGIAGKQALDFVRCATVVVNQAEGWNMEALFPDLDPRTASRLRRLAAFGNCRPADVPPR